MYISPTETSDHLVPHEFGHIIGFRNNDGGLMNIPIDPSGGVTGAQLRAIYEHYQALP